MSEWGTSKEIETRRRIRLTLWAVAYEFKSHSIVSDAVYDFESYNIDVNINTNRPDLDEWFRGFFEPCTGIWIHKHPELDKVKQLYERLYDDI